MASISERESKEIEAANASARPSLFAPGSPRFAGGSVGGFLRGLEFVHGLGDRSAGRDAT